MKKTIAILLVMLLSISLFACGNNGGDANSTTAPDASSAQTTKADANAATDASENAATEAPTEAEPATEVSLVATGANCTITVPKIETFFDGYKGTTVKYNNPEPHRTVYVNLYGEETNLEVNISVTQLTISSAETHDAKGYAEYYNARSKIYEYKPVEIAGYSGYLAEAFHKTSQSTDNYYLIDYPLSNGTSVIIHLCVTQRYGENTSEMTPVAEAFLKNIQVTAIDA